MARRAAVAVLLAGCVNTGSPAPVEAFSVPPAAAAERVLQSRRYDTRDEVQVLRASAALLSDLGFTIDKSDESIGVLVASKDRSAVETGQVILAVILSGLTRSDVPYDHHQKMRASVVTHPAQKKSIVVRVTFQRIVWDSHGSISKREQLNQPEFYQEFFEKLSKALLLEAYERMKLHILPVLLLAACNYSHKELLKAPEEQAALRTMQTRIYDTTDDQKTLRAVIATLQDLGFVIDDGNAMLGIVSATKFEAPRYGGGGAVRIQVAVKRHGEKQTSVRASAQAGNTAITDPAAYQEFFISLSKGMFLTAHEIE